MIEPPSASPVLDYRTTTDSVSKPPSKAALYVALLAALIPMLLGTVDIALWLLTFSKAFEAFGIIIVIGGLIFFAIGSICLLIHLVTVLRRPKNLRRQLLMILLAAILLVANFPLAGFYMNLAERSHVRVINQTGMTIDAAVAVDPDGNKYDFGSIASGATASRRIRPRGEGAFNLLITSNGASEEVELDSYTSDGPMTGKRLTVTVTPTKTSVKE